MCALAIIAFVALSLIGLVFSAFRRKWDTTLADMAYCEYCGGPCEDDYRGPFDDDEMRDW